MDKSSDNSFVTMPGMRSAGPAGRFGVGDLVLDRYKVLAELGQGGMGVVYRCFDETAGIEVALKALPPELSHNTGEMEEVKDNFQLVEKLHHPHIAVVKTLEKDKHSGNYFLIMECVTGENLRSWLRSKRKTAGGVPLADTLPILRQVAEALDYAHAQKIVHRDIKPANIMITADGTVKVLDFGLAAQIHTSMTRVSMAYHGTSGTGPYMAPEQWRGQKQDAAADQYALAVMAYEMLAGNLPFDSHDAAVLQQAVLTQEPKPVPGLPDGAVRALKAALSKEPARRYATCAEFVRALAGEKIATPGKANGNRRSKRFGIAVALALLLAAGGILVAYHMHRNAEIEQRRIAEAEVKRIAEEKAKQERLAEEKAKREAEHQRLTVELSAARDAKSAGDWDRVRQHAEALLAMSPGHVEAQNLKREAAVRSMLWPKPGANFSVLLPDNRRLAMIWVQSGSFLMGSPEGELGRGSDGKQHCVTLTQDFWIGKYEVTQAQYEAVMNTNPSIFKGENRPVENVSWEDAMTFCRKLNQLCRDRLPAGYEFTLPTEAQWEYACRAGTTTAFHYGNDLDSSMANFDGNHPAGNGRKGECRQKTVEVGSFEPNAWGLYDMHGNVWEWCRDWYGDYGGNTTDPVGPNDGSYRVDRGGGWFNVAAGCRSANRFNYSPGFRGNYLGFRVSLASVQ